MGGEAALSVEARYLEPELPIELDDAYQQTFDRLRRKFQARGCSPEESADLAQEAAVRAFVHIRRWGVASSGLDPLLNRIARNLLIDRYRRAVPHVVSLDSADEIQDPAQDPTEEAARRQRRTVVRSAIRSLPVRHQKAIVYSLSGLSPEEVGKEMGIGRNAADALLHRARRSLREHLAPVRDGMWALALGVRIRLDRLLRRAGMVPSGAVEASGTAFGAGLAIAAAAVVAVVVAGGGGGGGMGNGSFFRSPAFALAVGIPKADRSSAAGAGTGQTSGLAPFNAWSYRLGSNTTDFNGSHGVSNDWSVPDPGNPKGPPLIEIRQWVWRDGKGAPPPDNQPDAVSRIVCRAAHSACGLTSPNHG